MTIKILLSCFLVFITAIGACNPSYLYAEEENKIYQQLDLFGQVFDYVRKEYVTKPNEASMIENAIKGMLSSLDPHSSYLNPEQAKEIQEITKGAFAGLGVVVTMDKGLVKVITAMVGTPAARAGLLTDDYISKIDGKDIISNSLNDNVNLMRGPVGSTVRLTILRKGVVRPFDLEIKREIIKLEDVNYKILDDIAYIRIIQFTKHTSSDLIQVIKKIQNTIKVDKFKGYIIDLRLNPGGLLDQAVAVSDCFLDKGVIVYTKGRQAHSDLYFKAKTADITQGKPIIVLINGGTASAAEIVAGALQDNKRAKILGSRSFGKGSVQSIIMLGKNGALRLTTALYYTPNGVSIQGHGIEPDYKISQPLPDKFKHLNLNLGESELPGHIKGIIEDNKGSGSAAYVPVKIEDDLQIKAACKLLHGKDISDLLDKKQNK